jgi:hypothetical protein
MIEELCCCTIIFVIIVIVLSRLFLRSAIFYSRRPAQQQYRNQPGQASYQHEPPANEVLMAKCPYCGSMYDERLPGCPKCGA